MNGKLMSSTEIDEVLAQGRVEGNEEWCYQFGKWKCFFCENENHGFVKNCGSCAAAKDERAERSEYLPEDALYYNEELAGKLADLSNPDWTCVHCETVMSHKLSNCSNCGAPASDQKVDQVSYELGEEPHSAEEALADYDERHGRTDRDPQTFTESNSNVVTRTFGSYLKLGGAGLLGIIGIGFIYWLLFATTVVHAKVTKLHWVRTVQMEKLVTLTEEGWSVPGGGRLLNSRRAIRDYDDVPDGFETKTRQVRVKTGTRTESKQERVQTGTKTSRYACGKTKTGSGSWKTEYCTKYEPEYGYRTKTYQEDVYGYRTETYQVQKYKKVPNYATKYTYEIDRWVPGRVVQSEGDGKEQARMYPLVSLMDREREASRTETLVVELVDEYGKTYVYNVDTDKWERVNLDQVYDLKFNNAGMMVSSDFP
mgnify:CR=1 FL=1